MTTNEATAGLRVGDTVIVVDRRQTHHTAYVEKAARVWLTLVMVSDTENGKRYLRTWRMRRDTQDGDPGLMFFYTLEQWAAREAETDARKVLSAAGISVDYGSPFKTRHLAALAGFVRERLEAEREADREANLPSV